MGLKHGLLAYLLEKIPLVDVEDISGDGDLELVIGPRRSGAFGTILRYVEPRQITIWKIVFVLGVK
ncbi:hypothetical protein C482_15493 [Natrialba chahannaoensis JCM 10990]|uniref:Uncharacterized protein n=1 Tax=Natrialba chahannaoensis JCM 10990 TaxID=1227492 RepID=M0AD22_9EURY|nr:hypothetical protein [Natrialba chahannaoensis]ELY96645.1 hypothetical protein C482_15493 [Natrialba chahannaoensis JCM 10990]